jgi:hypothetical protein
VETATTSGTADVWAGLREGRSDTGLDFLPPRNLTAQKEGLGELALTTDLEGTEISEPEPFRSLGFGLSPELELIEVVDGDLAFSEPIEKVFAEGWRKIRPLNPRH